MTIVVNTDCRYQNGFKPIGSSRVGVRKE